MKFQIFFALALFATVFGRPSRYYGKRDTLDIESHEEKSVEETPREVEKRFWGLYGLGGMYGYGLGFGYPFGLWGKRDTLDIESHEQKMTEEEITAKREEMMTRLMEAEKRFYEIEDGKISTKRMDMDMEKVEERTPEEKRQVEKRFWGLYGGLYGLGLGYGYPFGYGLWGKRDTDEKKVNFEREYIDVHQHGHGHKSEQEHIKHDHPEMRFKREAVDETVEEIENVQEEESVEETPREVEKRFWGLYGLGGMYGYGLGFGYPFGFWGKRDTLDVESHEQKMTNDEITAKREEMMTRLMEAEKRFYDMEAGEVKVEAKARNFETETTKTSLEEKRQVEKRFWGLYGGLYGLGLGYGYPFGFGLWGKRDL